MIIDSRVVVAYRSNRLWAYAAWDAVPGYPARFARMLGRTSPLLGDRSVNNLLAQRRHPLRRRRPGFNAASASSFPPTFVGVDRPWSLPDLVPYFAIVNCILRPHPPLVCSASSATLCCPSSTSSAATASLSPLLLPPQPHPFSYSATASTLVPLLTPYLN